MEKKTFYKLQILQQFYYLFPILKYTDEVELRNTFWLSVAITDPESNNIGNVTSRKLHQRL